MSERIIVTYWKKPEGKAEAISVLASDYVSGISSETAMRKAKTRLKELGDGHGAWVTKQVFRKNGKVEQWENSGTPCVLQMVKGKATVISKFE